MGTRQKERSLTEVYFSDLQDRLGSGAVLATPGEFSSYLENCSGYQRSIAGVAFPATTEEVQFCVAKAREHHIPLYPISSGKNWGMGSKLPVEDGCVILDLQRLNKIRHVDTSLGFAVIEAGVTQEQLAAHLASLDSPYFLDVTGSSQKTTVIGNGLERGISYNGLRVDHLLDLEIVLGTGEVVKNGFRSLGDAPICHLYGHSLGPSLEGLFFQSNFGIVTAATVHLQPKHEVVEQFTLSIDDPALVPAIFEELRWLREQRVLFCTARAANRERMYPVIGPLMKQELERRGVKRSFAEINQSLQKYLSGRWFIAGSLSGSAEFVKVSKKQVKRRLKRFGRVKFMSERKARLLGRVASLLGMTDASALAAALAPLQGLGQGIPTDHTLPSMFWPVGQETPLEAAQQLDPSGAGVLFSAPFAPMTKQDVTAMIRAIEDTAAKFSFAPAITLNTATNRVVEGVISLHFDKNNAFTRNQAQACMKAINRTLREQGHFPYRLGIEDMPEVINASHPHWKLVRRLKGVFDPERILAPGRYE